MSKKITSGNIDAYLAYISKRIGKPIPMGYNASSLTKGGVVNSEDLVALYSSLNLSKQKGWSFEDSFLNDDISLDDITDIEAIEPVINDMQATIHNYNYNYNYTLPNKAIRSNYKAYIHWVGEQKGIALEHLIEKWDGYSDDQIWKALPSIYSQSGIMPQDAQQLEEQFLAVYGKSFAKPEIPVAPEPKIKKPVPVITGKEQPLKSSYTPPIKRKRKISTARIGIIATLLLVALLSGYWIRSKYVAYNELEYIYPIADNIAVRTDASDGGSSVERMDMFGEHTNGANGSSSSKSSYKVADNTTYNGYYRVLKEDGFMNYLFKGESNVLYVHSELVTTDRKLYEHYLAVFANLKTSFNDLDKLKLNVRKAIINASYSRMINIATPCRIEKTVNSETPLTFFKFIRKATKEMVVIYQSTDNQCYYISATTDGNVLTGPMLIPVYGETYLPAGGRFQYKNKVCIYTSCTDNFKYTATYPFVQFTRIN